MFVFGGRKDVSETRFTGDSVYLNDMYAFDMKSRQWNKIVNKLVAPSERRSHTAVVLGKKLLIFGGVQENLRKHYNDMYEFDTETSEWRRVRACGLRPQPRRRHSCHVINDQMFVFSGSGPITMTRKYDEPSNMSYSRTDSNHHQVGFT